MLNLGKVLAWGAPLEGCINLGIRLHGCKEGVLGVWGNGMFGFLGWEGVLG